MVLKMLDKPKKSRSPNMNLKSNVKIVICALMVAIALSACSSKKQPVGNFQSVECRTICSNGECTQQCVGASGDYYAK